MDGGAGNGKSTEDKMSLQGLKSAKGIHLQEWVNSKKLTALRDRGAGVKSCYSVVVLSNMDALAYFSVKA